MSMRLSDDEKRYLYLMFHVLGGRVWFGPDDLQVVASLVRRGLVTLEPDCEGHEAWPTDAGRALSKKAEAWEPLWRKQNEARPGLLP